MFFHTLLPLALVFRSASLWAFRVADFFFVVQIFLDVGSSSEQDVVAKAVRFHSADVAKPAMAGPEFTDLNDN